MELRTIRNLVRFALLAFTIALSGCASAWIAPDGKTTQKHVQIGEASWYGKQFQGRKTASGTPFDKNKLTAAHPTLPFGTRLRVTNLSNQRTAIVTVTDRGPFAHGRIVDLSWKAAKVLGFVNQGTAHVKLELVEN